MRIKYEEMENTFQLIVVKAKMSQNTRGPLSILLLESAAKDVEQSVHMMKNEQEKYIG